MCQGEVLDQNVQAFGTAKEQIGEVNRFVGMEVQATEDSAQVAVADRLADQGHAVFVSMTQTGSQEGPYTILGGTIHEGRGAIQVVGIGQGERGVAERRRPFQESLRSRDAFKEGIPAVSVQGHGHGCIVARHHRRALGSTLVGRGEYT